MTNTEAERGEKEEKSTIMVCLYSTLRTFHKYQAIHKGMWLESQKHTHSASIGKQNCPYSLPERW